MFLCHFKAYCSFKSSFQENQTLCVSRTQMTVNRYFAFNIYINTIYKILHIDLKTQIVESVDSDQPSANPKANEA